MTHVIYGNCINLHAISLYVHWAFFSFLYTKYCQMLATHTHSHTRIILANRKTSSTMFCNILDNHLKQIRLRLLPNNEIINSTLCHFACYPKPYSTVSKHSQTKRLFTSHHPSYTFHCAIDLLCNNTGCHELQTWLHKNEDKNISAKLHTGTDIFLF